MNGVNTGSPSVIRSGFHSATNPLQPVQPCDHFQDERPRIATRDRQLCHRGATGRSQHEHHADGRQHPSECPGVQAKISNLEQDSLSNDPSLNTEVSVLNKINATNILMLRTLQDANNLRLAELEQQTVRSKQERDDITTSLTATFTSVKTWFPRLIKLPPDWGLLCTITGFPKDL